MDPSGGGSVNPTQLLEVVRGVEGILDMGQPSIDGSVLRLHILEPMKKLLGARAEPEIWMTLSEAMQGGPDGTGPKLSKNYFHKPLSSLGGRSRLQVWEKKHLARQTPEKIWIVSSAALPDSAGAEKGHSQGLTPDDITRKFQGK